MSDETSASGPPMRRKNRRRIARYGPLLVWLSLIFFASSGELSSPHTSRLTRPLLQLFFPFLSEEQFALLHYLIRKTAHFTEYAILAMLAARAFLSSSHHILRRHWFSIVLISVAIYALLDEYHQSFVPAREASIYDSLLDTVGGTTALALIALWRAARNRQGKKPRL
jgi:VanZ family protein